MRRIVIELTDKLEECFECLNDELAAKSIINILKQRAYIELRSDGRESGRSGSQSTTPLPETDFRKESEKEKDKKIDELYKMVSNLTTAISSGSIQANSVTRDAPVQPVATTQVNTANIDLSAAMGALANKQPVKREEPKKMVADDSNFDLDDLEALLK